MLLSLPLSTQDPLPDIPNAGMFLREFPQPIHYICSQLLCIGLHSFLLNNSEYCLCNCQRNRVTAVLEEVGIVMGRGVCVCGSSVSGSNRLV